jgi:hypothetical protein
MTDTLGIDLCEHDGRDADGFFASCHTPVAAP